jgi:phosphatidylserine/phosphatidylglycerophosphate/cardiolipin synthase-like enzyme
MKIAFIFLLIFMMGCATEGYVVKEYAIYEENKEPMVCFTPENDCGKLLASFIRNSSEIKCAFYDLNLDYLIEVLKEKNAQVIIEDRNAHPDFFTGENYALMHHKFCVLDSEIVITGSMNPTNNCGYKNDNNMVIIFSKYLAKNYLDEFEEMMNGIYGKGGKTKYPIIYLNNKKIENYFCPEDNCKDKVINKLENAQESIYFMFFSFTDRDIADEIIYQSKRIDVKGVTERRRVNMQYEQFKYLVYNNVSVVPDTNPAVMHHKTIIIDNITVITGSYNPTKSGNERNDENILIIDDKRIAKEFLKEFEKLYHG